MATLLRLIQDITCMMTAVEKPSSVVSNQNIDIQRLLVQANICIADMVLEGNDLGGWRHLHKDHKITTVSDQSLYDLPNDFGVNVSGSEWNTSQFERLIGPVSPHHWAFLVNGIHSVGHNVYYRIIGDKFEIYPKPQSGGLPLVLAYVSKYGVLASDGIVAKESFTQDADTILVDDMAFKYGTLYRFLSLLGLPSEFEFAQYNKFLRAAIGRSSGIGVVNIGKRNGFRLIDGSNIADGAIGV